MTQHLEVLAPESVWAITDLEHPGYADYRPDCAECLALVDDAVSLAVSTGSRGATASREALDKSKHGVTVARARAVLHLKRGGETAVIAQQLV